MGFLALGSAPDSCGLWLRHRFPPLTARMGSALSPPRFLEPGLPSPCLPPSVSPCPPVLPEGSVPGRRLPRGAPAPGAGQRLLRCRWESREHPASPWTAHPAPPWAAPEFANTSLSAHAPTALAAVRGTVPGLASLALPASPAFAVLGGEWVAAESRPRLRPAPLPASCGEVGMRGAGVPLSVPEGWGLLAARRGGERLPPPAGFLLKINGVGGRRNEGGDGRELGYTTSVLASAPSLASSLETTTCPLFTSPLVSPVLFLVLREGCECVCAGASEGGRQRGKEAGRERGCSQPSTCPRYSLFPLPPRSRLFLPASGRTGPLVVCAMRGSFNPSKALCIAPTILFFYFFFLIFIISLALCRGEGGEKDAGRAGRAHRGPGCGVRLLEPLFLPRGRAPGGQCCRVLPLFGSRDPQGEAVEGRPGLPAAGRELCPVRGSCCGSAPRPCPNPGAASLGQAAPLGYPRPCCGRRGGSARLGSAQHSPAQLNPARFSSARLSSARLPFSEQPAFPLLPTEGCCPVSSPCPNFQHPPHCLPPTPPPDPPGAAPGHPPAPPAPGAGRHPRLIC